MKLLNSRKNIKAVNTYEDLTFSAVGKRLIQRRTATRKTDEDEDDFDKELIPEVGIEDAGEENVFYEDFDEDLESTDEASADEVD